MGESDSSSASGLGLGDVSLHVIEPNRRAEDLHAENLLVVQEMHQSSSCLQFSPTLRADSTFAVLYADQTAVSCMGLLRNAKGVEITLQD
jgi:hypothetical protein